MKLSQHIDKIIEFENKSEIEFEYAEVKYKEYWR